MSLKHKLLDMYEEKSYTTEMERVACEMYQNILLTFNHVDGYYTYAWFETEDDAREFASNATQITCINEGYDC